MPEHRRRAQSLPAPRTAWPNSSEPVLEHESDGVSGTSGSDGGVLLDPAAYEAGGSPPPSLFEEEPKEDGVEEMAMRPRSMSDGEKVALSMLSIGAISDCIASEQGTGVNLEEVGYGRQGSKYHVVLERPKVDASNCVVFKP